ncbi:hypothetical protein Ocin01_18142, partial [Orchesella cincta]
MIALHNCDELFDWVEENELHFGLVKSLDTSVVGIRPSLREFNSLMKDWNANWKTNFEPGRNIGDKYNRGLLVDSDMLCGNGTDISMVTLPEKFNGEVETQSETVFVEIVEAYWKRIKNENVGPLLESLTK